MVHCRFDPFQNKQLGCFYRHPHDFFREFLFIIIKTTQNIVGHGLPMARPADADLDPRKF